MKLIPLVAAIIVTSITMVFTIQPASAASKMLKLTRTIALEELSAVKLETVNGSIDVKPYDGTELTADLTLEAKAETKTRAEELVSSVKVTAAKNGKWADVIATFPRTRQNETVKVDISVKIPARWSGGYGATTENGNLTFKGLSGKAVIKTTNGNINIADWNGIIDANTVNGNIQANKLSLTLDSILKSKNGNLTVAPGVLSSPLEVSTINGIVTVELPPVTKANLETQVTNGLITVSGWGYDLTSKGTFKTKLGNGGPRLQLHVENGEIRVTSK